MSIDIRDLSRTIIPKSDQLNSEQLLTGPMTVTITDVSASGSAEQPVTVHYAGEDGRPYRPCKTMRRLMIFAWGADGNAWIGKSMTLYHDPSIKWGGEAVGGIRISHMSDIPKDISVKLTLTRSKKTVHDVKVLQVSRKETLKDKAARIVESVKAGDVSEVAQKLATLKQSQQEALMNELDADTRAAITAEWSRRAAA